MAFKIKNYVVLRDDKVLNFNYSFAGALREMSDFAWKGVNAKKNLKLQRRWQRGERLDVFFEKKDTVITS